jgi:CheY-like chemotaxis protein
MSERPLKLLLIDQDPIFRLGLEVALEGIANLEVVAAAETDTTALQILSDLTQKDSMQVNLVVLELGNSRSSSSKQLGLQLCEHLKAQYPNLPILLLSFIQEQELLLAARAVGVDGYCPKGTPVSELIIAMQELVNGGSYWNEEQGKLGGIEGFLAGEYKARSQGERFLYPRASFSRASSLVRKSTQLPLAKMRNKLRLSGINYINSTLAEVTAQLQTPGLPVLDRAILAGQRRELLAARWFVNQLLSQHEKSLLEKPVTSTFEGYISRSKQLPPPPNTSFDDETATSNVPKAQEPASLGSPRSLQAELFTFCINKIQSNLPNVTDVPLEMDILRHDKKQELLYLILQKVADSLEEIRRSHIESNQLFEIKNNILLSIWETATTDFFGKFSRVQVDGKSLDLIHVLLQSAVVIQTEILNRIPLVVELYAYLLFQDNLQIDNTSYSAGSYEAKTHASMILENLLIQVGNSVVQPLLNSLADVEEIKQSFYDRKLISTREIEKFRNNLSWKYRLRNYITEPTAIFESRYELFIFAPRGIATVSIYAPRSQELSQLTGIPLFVTLGVEFRDALAPRLQSLLSLLGSGVVFVLTQVVGRGLGLIVRGILQGIGSVSISEKRNKKF